MNTCTHVPPGFRFHPTDEELVDYYLRRKINSRRIDLDIIKEVDLYKIEPWDLLEICRLGDEDQSEWYFFSHKDKKYPTGTRTNRATAAGFWKATGRDKAIYSKHDLVGMRKTLVYYKGRAPNGQKSDWIMHEYRLETDENGPPQEEGWVVCRAFKKKPTTIRRMSEHDSPYWYEDQASLMSDLDSPKQNYHSNNNMLHNNNPTYNHKRPDLLGRLPFQIPHQDHLIHLPLLQNSKLFVPSSHHGTTTTATTTYNNNNNALVPYGLGINQVNNPAQQIAINDNNNNQSSSMVLLGNNNQINDQSGFDQLTDWRVLDKFVASQLSQEDVSKEIHNNYSSVDVPLSGLLPGTSSEQANKEASTPENTSTSTTSSSQMDAWK